MKLEINLKEPTLYAIFLNKVEGKELSKEIIENHVSHLRSLDEQNKLVLSGPFSDHGSGLVIVTVSDKSEAISIAESDPFVKEGVRSFEVRSWQIAHRENNYLG
ncbi:MAG: hypothetical protein H6626_02765 [Pseudobdellovibrionaceae bacterium]|nr:MAG: hypothetical protein H6626_02765 [Pseudobdellovibrionaceae bacterium]